MYSPSSVYDPYKDFFVPAINTFVDIELRGFPYDVGAAADLREDVAIPRLTELKDELRDVSGRSLLNPGSWKQLQAFMYEECGLSHDLKVMKGGVNKKAVSTDKDVRREVVEGRFRAKATKRETLVNFCGVLNTWSELDKQRGTYLEGLIKRVAEDGRLYPNFKFGTVSGRTSSDNPNFQNITRSAKDVLPGVRSLFTSGSPDYVVIQADFSQAELRTMAYLSGDEELLAIYADPNRSLHKERAAHFYGKDYTYEQYTKAKNINFGVSYGQSAFAFAQMYSMPQAEAQAYIDDWWTTFPMLKKWTETVKEEVSTGEIVSPFGMKRRFHLRTEDNRGELEREAVNFLPQNIASCFTVHGCIDLNRMGVPIVSTVHDSIIAIVHRDDSIATGKTMKEVMEAQAPEKLGWDTLPFLVDISIGPNWGAVEEVDLMEAA